ncbi:HAD family hydrolase [Phenylobacterium sp. Root700]|uniref:HAD-IIIC family phosphatase n=1 Tax=Phenylobacterium sp. Root700 TaxID=1736591 RepID=UPI0006FD640D|nr:HAD-IIIC family phosphatase [Phenylobacterium sp. Root700]KRB41980.1 hypothetical protein ASE02_03980 [Phenylobacterium sp. Root700]
MSDQVAPPADPRAAIDAALKAEDRPGARRLATAYWRDNSNSSVARYLLARLEQFWPADRVVEHRVAFLRSYTVEPVLPLLQATAALAGCRLVPWVGEFNAYGQEILSPQSGLYAHNPDTVVMAVQTRDISPSLWFDFAGLSDDTVAEEVTAAAARLGKLVEALRGRTSAHIIVHGLEPPLHPNDGLLGQRRRLTQAEAIAAANRALRERLAGLPDVHLLDFDALQARHGRERFYSAKKWAAAKLPLSVEALGWLAAEWWRHLSMLALPQAKVLVLDLDNTLWGGTIGEDGMTGIALSDEHPGVFHKDLQRAILDVARRGVILAIASKNNLDDAMQVLNEHPDMLLRREHFAAMRVNWDAKSTNLASMAAELNLGLESFVFLDDNPVERDAVRRSLPEVIVPELGRDPSTYAGVLRDLPALERLQTSAEDAERTRYYVEQRARREVETSAESVEDFLASLEVQAEITPIDAMSLGRAAQLTQKTNQLNLTTRRFSEAQLAERLATPGWNGYVLRASDRFGDNGIVGVALTHSGDEICEVDALLLSCRVIGRQIETAFLSFLAATARAGGQTTLRGWYIPTAKNAPARGIYEQAGFTRLEARDGAELWHVDVTATDIRRPEWLALRTPSTASGS